MGRGNGGNRDERTGNRAQLETPGSDREEGLTLNPVLRVHCRIHRRVHLRIQGKPAA
jgi:hypothetical protein